MIVCQNITKLSGVRTLPMCIADIGWRCKHFCISVRPFFSVATAMHTVSFPLLLAGEMPQ